MFKYNELSDLIDGSLVTPLSLNDDGSIHCIKQDGTEQNYFFEDFDFDKTISERNLNTDSLENEADELIKEPEEDPKEDITYQDMLDEMEKDDAIFDGTDDMIIPEPSPEPVPEIEAEGFCNDLEINSVLKLAGIQKKPGVKYNVWKDII